MKLNHLPEDTPPTTQGDSEPAAIPGEGESGALLGDGHPSALGGEVARFVPSEVWLEAFEAECTEDVLKRARYFAAQRARDLGWQMAGPGVYDPDELVDNIVKETLAGRITWNPARQKFGQHLYDAVRVRILRHAQRAWQYPHESVDVEDADGESSTLAAVEAQLLADSPDSTTIDTAERVDRTVGELRRLAVNKPLVQRLLAAFERRKFSREEIMATGEFTLQEYQSARRQLTRLVDLLPDHLKPRMRGVTKGA